MGTRGAVRRRPHRTFGRRLALSAAALAALAGCSRQNAFPQVPLPVAARAWVPALPATHEPLSAALAAAASGRGGAAGRARDDAFRDYLATLARNGPGSRPELFPSPDGVLAYLVDAHLAWTLALGRSQDRAGVSVGELRTLPVEVDGRTTSLEALAAEIAARAPWEPRLALFLNPGWRGGPPLPQSAVEGRSLDWQLALQADRCGKTPEFWTLDSARRRLGVSVYTELMWGLPADRPVRMRRLLDLVPPPKPLLEAIVSTCGAALQRCELATTPIDFGRLLAPEAPPAGDRRP